MSAPVTTPAVFFSMRMTLGRFAVVLDDQRLDVQDDVGHVLDDAGDRGELVLDAVDLDLRDRRCLRGWRAGCGAGCCRWSTPKPRSNGSAMNLP